MTLPISLNQAVLGKFLAAWCFTAIALALTFPLWITVNYLGNPDNGALLAGYIGGLLMGGAFLAIGSFVSALTKNQVIAFVVAVTIWSPGRSAEHTSELQTLMRTSYAVFCLKKKTKY